MSAPASIPPKVQPKHVPERSCVACRKKRPQAEFLRFTKGEDGQWGMDTRHKARTGRGVYLCADSPECWKEKRLRRTFGAQSEKLAMMLTAFHTLRQEATPVQ